MRLHSMRIYVASLITLLSFAVVCTAQETIPERVARGVKGKMRGTPSGRPPSVSELLPHTDLIVRGKIGEPRTYMSSDLTEVYTDYPLENAVILFQLTPATSQSPGIQRELAVTIAGGELSIGGTTYTQYEEALPALPVGAEGFFLLKNTGEHYMVSGLSLGAFVVTPGELVPLTHKSGFAEEYRGVPAAESIGRIVAEIREMRRQPPHPK
jgi:hypothetical protein